MRRFGMPVSDTTILAGLRKHARARSESSAVAAVHVAGVDDWAWRKGSNYGTIIVDLEHRVVVDVLADRSAAPRPVGSGIIRKWRWSAATVLGSMRRLRVRARRRRGAARPTRRSSRLRLTRPIAMTREGWRIWRVPKTGG